MSSLDPRTITTHYSNYDELDYKDELLNFPIECNVIIYRQFNAYQKCYAKRKPERVNGQSPKED